MFKEIVCHDSAYLLEIVQNGQSWFLSLRRQKGFEIIIIIDYFQIFGYVLRTWTRSFESFLLQ